MGKLPECIKDCDDAVALGREVRTPRVGEGWGLVRGDAWVTGCGGRGRGAVRGHCQVRADFKMLARAMARKGNALVKGGDLEGAIAAYGQSLMEHRTADTLKRLNETERTLKEKRQAEYEDPVKAEEAREARACFGVQGSRVRAVFF